MWRVYFHTKRDTLSHMQDDLRSSLNTELSQLIRQYDREGLEAETISDSLDWHSELALVLAE